MSDSLYSECEKFIRENKKRYERLLEEVLGLANQVRQLDRADRIYRIYSRGDNGNEDGEFKRTTKVAEKLAKWRKNYNPRSRVEEIHDIIGITIVVRYDSDIASVYDMVKWGHQSRGLKIISYLPTAAELAPEEFRQYKKLGYHARHMVLSYSNPVYGGLKCEIQIKTLLHDAWGAKTYSLTYKPAGELPDELRTIMEAFGESIQALEVQSELMRTFITREWEEENELRYTCRLGMMSSLEERGFEDDDLRGQYREIFHRIHNNQEKLRLCSPDDPTVEALVHEIARLKEAKGGAAAAWPLMMYLASCRVDNHLNFHARKYVEEWAEEDLSDPAERLFYVSSAYYIIGERSAAIEAIQRFLAAKPLESLTISKLRLNILYYLVEEAVYSSYRATEIKSECDQLIAELPFDDLEKFPEEKMRCAAVDTKGYYKIVFGETKREIEEGIRLCQKAYPEGEAEKLGGYYGILHQRTGWRRYLRARH